jgi:hypothetical protein
MTAETVAEHDVVLCVGDTTFLDYGSIAAKKEGYGSMVVVYPGEIGLEHYPLQWSNGCGCGLASPRG